MSGKREVIKHLPWGAEAFSKGYEAKINFEGVSNKLQKYGGGMKRKLAIYQTFTNNSTSQIVKTVSHHLMIILQCQYL